MASMNISIKQEAYDFLKELKSEDKSFSDVILSFKKEENDVMKFFGMSKEEDWEEREKEMASFRKEFDER